MFAQRSTPLRQNLKLTKKLTLTLTLNLVIFLGLGLGLGFVLVVYSAGQKYRWLIFLVILVPSHFRWKIKWRLELLGERSMPISNMLI